MQKEPAKKNKVSCINCGNNPIPHDFAKFDSFMAVSMVDFGTMFFSSNIGKWSSIFVVSLLTALSKLFVAVGLMSLSDDIEKAPGRRAQVLWEEAKRRGIEMQNLCAFGKHLDLYRAKIGNKWLYFDGLPRVGEHSSLVWMDDKAILKKNLSKEGIPVARGGSFTGFKEILRMFSDIDKPVIVKPRLGSRGRHTTTFISNEKDLHRAYKIAKELCHFVIMEEHLEGSVYRGTVIDGKLVAVLGGDPPRVTGDGHSSIKELIEIKNQNKMKGVSDFVIKDSTHEFLKRQGYDLRTILPEGQTIDLTEKIGVSYGGLSIDVTDITHPEIKRALEHAGRVIDDPILGFDFIIRNVSSDPKDQKWGIIECNAVPFINLHHEPLVGKPINVASHIWEYVKREMK